MAIFCLAPAIAEQFKQALINGEIDPQKLSLMSSEERNDFLKQYVGDSNSTKVNALFESKLLLKNQQRGMISWASRVLKGDPLRFNDMTAKIGRLDKVLSAEDEQSFLHDLATQRLGLDISYQEAQDIYGLSKKVKQKQQLKGGSNRLDYGRAAVDLNNYVNDLKRDAEKLTFTELKKKPIDTIKKATLIAAGTSKSIKVSLDNSALLRQGWGTLMTHPKIWAKNAVKSFDDIIKTFGNDTVMDELNADIISRENYDLMKKAKLAVGTIEEAYPESLPEKIPILGKAFKASENAYTAFLHKTRADVFDKYIDIAKSNGVELNNDELRSIGKMVNALTGRGDLGRLEGSAVDALNSIMFSPRNTASKVAILTQPLTGAGGSSFVRKQAAINLVRMIGGSAAILGIAAALDPESVETDPRSADFGKIVIGNTSFDVTGGNAQLFVLASRLITQKTKSTTSKKLYDLNTGKFGSATTFDVALNFFTNKASPVGRLVIDLLKQETFDREKPTVEYEVKQLLEPLPISTFKEAAADPKANALLVTLADALGVSSNTYERK